MIHSYLSEYRLSLATLDTISVDTRVSHVSLDIVQSNILLELAVASGRARPHLKRVLVAKTAYRRVASDDRWAIGDVHPLERDYAANCGLGIL